MSQDIVERILYTKTTSPFEHLNKYDIGENAVLMFLSNNIQVTSGDISRELRVSTARTSRILNQLEKKSFIIRIDDENDRRKTLVLLTNLGKREIIKRKENLLIFINKIVDKFGNQKINEYLDICDYFNSVINEEKED